MKLTSHHTQVLIVGAGPSGLMMAAQLIRYGIAPLIIDSKQGPTEHTKALAVQARSLEIYRQMGIADAVISGGKPAKGFRFTYNGRANGYLPIEEIGKGQTLYPYVFIYPQSKNERVLLNTLTQNTVPVYWNTKLIELKPDDRLITAVIEDGNEQINITADWVIGADGAHSTVRQKLHIPFHGDTYPQLFYLADIVATHTGDDMEMYVTSNGFAGFFPTEEKNGFRIIGNLPKRLIDKHDLTFDDVLPDLERVKGSKVIVNQCKWFTTYKLHHRKADSFRSGRCFLIGDAAHIHSPVGGQGMNTGLQDAYNLAWKLAGVINGKIQERVLDSYAAERMPVAKDLLKSTDRAFSTIMSNSLTARLFKRWMMPAILNSAWKSEKIKQYLFKRISQIEINYRHSEINLHLSQAHQVKAGDRLPYLKLYDEKKQVETDLHAWCSKPGFTLILFGHLQEQQLLTFAWWITHYYGQGLNFFYLPPSKRNQHVFDAFEIKPGFLKSVVVRPDTHIGFMCDSADMDVINNYLEQTTGLKRNS